MPKSINTADEQESVTQRSALTAMQAFYWGFRAHVRSAYRRIASRWRTHDPMTGALLRRAFDARAQRLLNRAPPDSIPSLMVINIDGFQHANGALGFDFGNRYLRELATLIQELAPTSLVARRTGAEFTALVPADVDPIQLAEHMRSTVELRYRNESDAVTVKAPGAGLTTPRYPSLNIRIGVSRRQSRDLQEHLALVEQATWQAAMNGRNRVEVAP